MRFQKRILSFAHATAFLRDLADSGELHLIGVGPEPGAEAQKADLSPQEKENLRQRMAELYRVNWRPHRFESWLSFASTLPGSHKTMKEIKARSFAVIASLASFDNSSDPFQGEQPIQFPAGRLTRIPLFPPR